MLYTKWGDELLLKREKGWLSARKGTDALVKLASATFDVKQPFQQSAAYVGKTLAADVEANSNFRQREPHA